LEFDVTRSEVSGEWSGHIQGATKNERREANGERREANGERRTKRENATRGELG
jgi:hypothetical protein